MIVSEVAPAPYDCGPGAPAPVIVSVYPVSVLPFNEAGAPHDNATCPLPAEAANADGADGAPTGVALSVAAALSPALLFATRLKE